MVTSSTHREPTCFHEGSNHPPIPLVLNTYVSLGTQATLGKVSTGPAFKEISGKRRLSRPRRTQSRIGLGASTTLISCMRPHRHINCALKKPPISTPLMIWFKTQPRHSNSVFSNKSHLTNFNRSRSGITLKCRSVAQPTRSSNRSPCDTKLEVTSHPPVLFHSVGCLFYSLQDPCFWELPMSIINVSLGEACVTCKPLCGGSPVSWGGHCPCF